MQIASLVPATVKCSSLTSFCSAVGLITNLPSTKPTITPATGPSNGIFDIPKHRDEPNNAVISGELSWSTDKTVLIT